MRRRSRCCTLLRERIRRIQAHGTSLVLSATTFKLRLQQQELERHVAVVVVVVVVVVVEMLFGTLTELNS